MAMIQQVETCEQNSTKVFDFLSYKKRKPFFSQPIKIKIGTPLNDTFHLVKNVVYKERQILALRHERELHTLILVEANIQEGKLISVSMLSSELMDQVCSMFEMGISSII